MALAKTSIFLLFFIVGTSMFLDGSSTRLAYAKPGLANAIYDDITSGLAMMIPMMPSPSQQPRSNLHKRKYYGSITNQEGATFHDENVRGTVSYKSITIQNGNHFA
uniref:Uncharacterized protein n=1 Tax=Glyptapanteles indiensis TaxID=92994 RepID=A0JCS6_GLYIN|nr:hypothetical protein GIP_L1_00350 [Glyptapanteles indiensis]